MSNETQRAKRAARHAEFHKLYARARDNEGGCVYCGGPSRGGRDHVPPLAFVDEVGPYGDLWLYDACGLCNIKLSAYPVACLVARAEYLLCVLRREWLLLNSGVVRRWRQSHVALTGVSVKRRLVTGETRARCRCAACQVWLLTNAKDDVKETPWGVPYAGKEIGQGFKPEWLGAGYDYDDGGLTPV